MRKLKVAIKTRFDPLDLYIHDSGEVTFKHVDGKKFNNLDDFKEKYKKHFKVYPEISE